MTRTETLRVHCPAAIRASGDSARHVTYRAPRVWRQELSLETKPDEQKDEEDEI